MNRSRRQVLAEAAMAGLFLCREAGWASEKTTERAQPRVFHLDDARALAEMRAHFTREHPAIRISRVEVEGTATLRTERGGMRVFWIFQGQGEVFLPRGYRTQEGDGAPLPALYRPEPVKPRFAETLAVLESGLSSLSETAQVPIQAVLKRRRAQTFVGDFAGDLWKLQQTPRPWSDDAKVEAAVATLFQTHREQGYSTKQADSWEPIQAGDQVIAAGCETVEVRGRFRCLAMENIDRPASHISTARRLRYLVDSAGGCNPDFAPFRRLPLTWMPGKPGEQGDGLNWVNSHVVNIPKETSPTHFHPRRPKIGGLPQAEMYLVLDAAAYQLNTWGRKASILLFPDLANLSRYEQHPLRPGMFVYIPPGTGHRGLDVFVNVLTIPGFKPHNELYLDRDIHDRTGGKSPYNEKLLGAKNYGRLEDFW